MLDLTNAISALEDDKVRRLVATHPELVNAVYDSKRPLDWALHHGNFIAYATLLRAGAKGNHEVIDHQELLGRHIYQICHNYFRSGWLDNIEKAIWEQLFEGKSSFYSQEGGGNGLSVGEIEDIKFLLKCCHINSIDEFIGFGLRI